MADTEVSYPNPGHTKQIEGLKKEIEALKKRLDELDRRTSGQVMYGGPCT